MVRHVRVHRADDRNVVDALSDMLEELAHFDPALAIFLEFERRRKGRAGFPFRPEILHRQRFSSKSGQCWLRIERINVGRPAIGKDVDDMLGLGRKVRLFGRERIGKTLVRLRRIEKVKTSKQAGQADRAHPQSATAEKFPPSQRQVFEICSVM